MRRLYSGAVDSPLAYRSLRAIPDGPDGVSQTLGEMANLAREGAVDLRVWRAARELTASLPDKDYVGEARAVHAFVQRELRYVADPTGTQMLQLPEVTLAFGGNCASKSILVAALLKSLGHPVRFVAAGFDGGPLEHVWPETKIGNSWFAIETTEPVPFGWRPPRISTRQFVYI